MENQRVESIDLSHELKYRTLKVLSRTALAFGLTISTVSAEGASQPRSISGFKRLVAIGAAPHKLRSFPEVMLPVESVSRYAKETTLKQERLRQADKRRLFGALAWASAVGASQTSKSDEAFLSCTRDHESNSAGGYQAISPDRQYYGAYQFLVSTWNHTAEHVGRLDLVGVRPDHASPDDQNALALDLYHWQGNGPWEGRC